MFVQLCLKAQNIKTFVAESIIISFTQTLRKQCPNTEFFLVRILLYSDQKKLRIWTFERSVKHLKFSHSFLQFQSQASSISQRQNGQIQCLCSAVKSTKQIPLLFLKELSNQVSIILLKSYCHKRYPKKIPRNSLPRKLFHEFHGIFLCNVKKNVKEKKRTCITFTVDMRIC